MDIVFQAKEAKQYETWLETGQGRNYLAASNALVDRVLDCHPGWRVLDVGCGAGAHLARLMERGVLVSGLEAGPVMAKTAQERLGEKASIKVGDAHDLPYEDNEFDAVIMVNTLELVERRGQVLAEATRVAASRVCLVSANPYSLGWPFWKLSPGFNPLAKGRPLAPWTMSGAIRDVLGPVPKAWASTWLMPRLGPFRWPFGSLMAVCAAVTPRFRTRGLTVPVQTPAAARRLAGSHGRVGLERVK